jgi:hypothetical protein
MEAAAAQFSRSRQNATTFLLILIFLARQRSRLLERTWIELLQECDAGYVHHSSYRWEKHGKVPKSIGPHCSNTSPSLSQELEQANIVEN